MIIIQRSALTMDLLPYIGRREEHRRSAFDLVTKLLIPLSALVVGILGWLRKSPYFLSTAMGLALLLLAVGVFPPLAIASRRWFEHVKDKRAARRAFPKLRNLVFRFGEFVDTSPSDTLHRIIQNEVNKAPGLTDRVPTVSNVGLWHAFWYFLKQRIERQQPSPSELRFALAEFYNLVSSYDMGCVVPVFNYPTTQFREWLTTSPPARSSLNEFQHRFLNFLLDYEKFAKELAESRSVFREVPRSFVHPKPL